jgi:hypothetical protein
MQFAAGHCPLSFFPAFLLHGCCMAVFHGKGRALESLLGMPIAIVQLIGNPAMADRSKLKPSGLLQPQKRKVIPKHNRRKKVDAWMRNHQAGMPKLQAGAP